MPLFILLLLPLLTALGILVCPRVKQVRIVALAGTVMQLLASIYLVTAYMFARRSGNSMEMLFQYRHAWFVPWRINYQVGVDGMSVAMILLTAVVVVAAVLVSWSVDTLAKEFFFLLLFLSLGAYGFFISLDLFLMFFFLEVAVIPKFLLIGIWGSGRKEYAAMKLALMLMAGSALVFVGLTGLYYHALTPDGLPTFDLLQIAMIAIKMETTRPGRCLPSTGMRQTAHSNGHP